MDLVAICQALVLISIANAAPVVAKHLLGSRFEAPIDRDLMWSDGRPLFGPSKTFRGVFSAIFACALGAVLLGLAPAVGALAGALAMAGDLLSSFLKRRLEIAPSGRAIFLDQVPEALLPTIALASPLGLSFADILIVTLIFWAASVALSPLFFLLGFKNRPH
jgi:CDP-archaeol synthase